MRHANQIIIYRPTILAKIFVGIDLPNLGFHVGMKKIYLMMAVITNVNK